MIFSYHAVPTEEEMFFIGRPHLRSPFSSAPIRTAFLSPCTVRPDTRGHVTECGALAFLQSLCYTDKQEIVPLCGIYFSWKGYHILWM